MKILFIGSFFSCLSYLCPGQSLEGDWVGYYHTDSNSFYPVMVNAQGKSISISLRFILNPDSTYRVYSFTTGLPPVRLDTVVICKMTGFIGKDSIYLEEVQVVLPEDYPPQGFQKMYLKKTERKKNIELTGTWINTESDKGGTIYFYKRKESF